MTLDHLRFVIQLTIGAVFAFSAISKLRRPTDFQRGVAEYRILPASLSSAFAFAVIGVEAFLAIAHLSGWGLTIAAPAGIALLLTFAAAVTISLARNRDLSCHCLGSGERVSPRSLLQLALLIAGESLVWSGAGTPGPATIAQQVATPGDLVVALVWVVVVLMAGLWVLHGNLIVQLFRSRGCKTCAGPPAELISGGETLL